MSLYIWLQIANIERARGNHEIADMIMRHIYTNGTVEAKVYN